MAERETADPLIGRTLGEFVIRDRIGEGGFGAVYRAVQPLLDREAVVKVLHARIGRSAAGTERFLREARLASRLDHPYAAHVYAFGAEPDGQLWIAMELVRGTPLDQLLVVQGPLALERFVPLLDRICEVVHTAHEQGIVHRDLKPANVMVLARAGRLLPKLLDFGIAKVLTPASTDPGIPAELPEDELATANTVAPEGTSSLTQRGSIMGSPLYMAPEQWVNAAAADARSDQYALGVLAYEALTGTAPFAGRSISAIAAAHARQALPPLGARFPPELDAVLGRAVAKDPEQRFATALELAAAFRAASGLAADTSDTLPHLRDDVREDAIASAPQPIAEAVAALEAARNAHQARDALWQLLRAIVRYVGLLALACRTRVGHGGDSEAPVVAEALRALYRRNLSDEEWLELAAAVTRPFRDKRDAYPIPELVGLFDEPRFAPLLALRAGDEVAVTAVLATGIEHMSELMRRLGFLSEYTLAVPVAGRIAERWMGVRRAQRATVAIAGRTLPVGEPALLDRDGNPVLSLAPMFQVAAPTPGAPLELFLFEGRGRRGAKLTALPQPFEHHDEALWDWFRAQLHGTLDEAAGDRDEEKPPYRGLSAFSADDAELFFGREALVDAFVNRLRVQPLIAVVGRSGAGKSSFLQAGVIPALPDGWRSITLRPGPAPMTALAARLRNAGITGEVTADSLGDTLRRDAVARGLIVLVIDQLEELFTLCLDPAERLAFATAVVGASRAPDDPVRVVFTLRDDFLVRAEQLGPFQTRIGQGLQLIAIPAAEDLVRVLVEPARKAGYELEDKQLPLEMVQEVADQPGALALLSFTAAKLWELRDRHFKQLTRKAYASLGGVGGALAKHAEQTIAEMSPEERRLVREAFRHLVTSQNTRAVVTRDELRQLLGGGAHADPVVEKLIAARLLVVSEGERGEDRVEIVHEALLSAWPRLVEWAREDREGARLRDQLRAAARQWDERNRSRGLLWRGEALADYERWRMRYPGALTDLESAFAQASLSDAARGRRTRRILIAAAFAGLAIAVFLLWRSNQRTEAQVAALYQEQGRQYYLAGDSLRASVYLVKAREAGASGPALDYLIARATFGLDRKKTELRHAAPVMSAAVSPDGTQLVTTDYPGTVRLWDAHTGQVRHELAGHKPGYLIATFSSDGKYVLGAGSDTTARLWDARSGAAVSVLAHGDRIETARFDREIARVVTASRDGTARIWEVNGRSVATLAGHTGIVRDAGFATANEVWTIADDGKVIRWNATTGAQLAVVATAVEPKLGIAFDPQGKLAVIGSADGTMALYRVDSGQAIATFTLGQALRPEDLFRVTPPVFAPDGQRFAVIVRGEIEVWSAADPPRRLVTLGGHRGSVSTIAFSADGTTLATGGEDGRARIWELATGELVASLDTLDQIHRLGYWGNDRLVTAGAGGLAFVWSATGDHATRRLAHSETVYCARLDPAGKRLVTTVYDKDEIVLWDVATGARLATRNHPGVVQATWDPSGRRIATSAVNGVATIFDATLEPIATLPGTTKLHFVAFSPDGSRLATADDAGKVRVWDLATARVLHEIPAHTAPAVAVEFDDRGMRIATAGRDNAARVWDERGRLVVELPHQNWVTAVTFAPGGKQLLTAAQRAAWIWDIASARIITAMQGHQNTVGSARFGANGLVVTAGYDETVKVWDRSSGRLLESLEGHRRWVRWAEVSPDGATIVTASDDTSAILWHVPRETRSLAELQRVLAERVPFTLRNGIVVPRR